MTFAYLFYEPGVTDRFYASRSELLQDLAGIVPPEAGRVSRRGRAVHPGRRPALHLLHGPGLAGEAAPARHPPEADATFAESIQADNACLAAARRPGIATAIHFCRGNMRGRWFASGGYDPVAEQLFGSLQADRFLLEYDSERAGGFEPLRFVPPGKTVVLGLVTTKSPELERQDDLQRRIDEAARFVSLENLAISPQCGFASAEDEVPLTIDQQRRKLELVVDTARKVWG